jgi:hypothetical protein
MIFDESVGYSKQNNNYFGSVQSVECKGLILKHGTNPKSGLDYSIFKTTTLHD